MFSDDVGTRLASFVPRTASCTHLNVALLGHLRVDLHVAKLIFEPDTVVPRRQRANEAQNDRGLARAEVSREDCLMSASQGTQNYR